VYIILASYISVIALATILPEYLLFWLLLFLILNLITFILVDRKTSNLAGSINYIIEGIRFLESLFKKRLNLLSLDLPDYKNLARIKAFGILFKDGFGGRSSDDVVAILIDYFRIFLGFQIIAFHFTNKVIQQNYQITRKIIYFIGYYDLINANLAIIENNKCVFTQFNIRNGIDFQNLHHPLIHDPIEQSLSLDKGAIITGLNMAGKSTLMRSIGLNQLLATSLGFCFAERYVTVEMAIVSSFRISDHLLQKKSRYFAEAERLSALLSKAQNQSCLIFIDEILTGTNAEERIYASVKILSQLSQFEKSIVLAATHDIQIAEQLKDNYIQIYFDGNIDNDQITFDFQPKKGIVSKKNGLKILKALGIEL
jgi:DNA mismatch repair ATPase MutS